MRTKLLLILSFVFFSHAIYSQKLSFEHINEQRGLDQINVFSLYQGTAGYIWIGTYFGLLRYNGHDFEKIIEMEGGIDESSIISICGNLKQTISLVKKGLYFVEKNTLTYHKVNFPANKIIKPHKVAALGKSILIAAEDGLWRHQIGTNKFENIHNGSPVTDIQDLGNGKIIYSNADGFYAYYSFTNKKVKIKHSPILLIKHFWISQNHEIAWLEAGNAFYTGTLNNNRIQIKSAVEIPEAPTSIGLIKYNEQYYIGTKKGLLEISKNGNTRYLEQDETDYFSLSQNNVSCFMVDSTNNFWVGTENGGLNLHNPKRFLFPLASHLRNANMAKCREIISLCETNTGEILFQNSLGGIGIFNPLNAEVRKWIKTDQIGNCMAPVSGQENQFLIGTPRGLYMFNISTEGLKFLSTVGNSKTFEGDIKCILPAEANTYWMGGLDGLFLYDLTTKSILKFYNIGNSNLGSDNIRSLSFKNKNELLLSTNKGLYLFKLNQNKFSLIPLSANKKEPFVTMAKADKLGNIWVSTAGNGLVMVYPNGTTKTIDKTSGLSDNQIYSLQFNKEQNQCWVATNKGISVVDMKDYSIKNYFLHDGLQGSEFIESSSTITKNGTIYFGGISGFNFFDPKKISTENFDCKIAINGLEVFNQKLPYQDYYKIPSSKNYISFDYTALDYNLSNQHTYYYKIEGIDTGYNNAGNRRFASFGQLSPGEYVFKVKVANSNGIMSKHEASIAFEIVPSFFQSYWFKIGSSLLLAALFALIIYFRTRKAIEEEKEKGIQSNMIASLELKALRAQMNPHFIFNSLNSIQYFVMNNEGKEAAKYLSKFAKLIRMILDISEQTFVTISAKVEFLTLYTDLEALRLNNSFTTDIWVDPKLDQSILIPTLLIQPHVENAIWHGLQSKKGSKSLLVHFTPINEETIQVIVQDNGIGRMAAMEIKKEKISLHQSKGSKISDDRINSLQKLFGSSPKIEIIDLYDENNLACGTKVVINVPIIHG